MPKINELQEKNEPLTNQLSAYNFILDEFKHSNAYFEFHISFECYVPFKVLFNFYLQLLTV